MSASRPPSRRRVRATSPPAYSTTVRLARALDAVAGPARATSPRSALGLHDTLVRVRQGPAGPRPVIVVLHDLHHADPASAAVLTDLLTRLRTGGLFVLATGTDAARLPAGTRAWWPWLFAEGDPTSAAIPARCAPSSSAAWTPRRRRARRDPATGLAGAGTGGRRAPRRRHRRAPGAPRPARAGTGRRRARRHGARPAWRSLSTDVGQAAAKLRPVPRRLLGALAVLGDPAPVALVEQVAGLTTGERERRGRHGARGLRPRDRHAGRGPAGDGVRAPAGPRRRVEGAAARARRDPALRRRGRARRTGRVRARRRRGGGAALSRARRRRSRSRRPRRPPTTTRPPPACCGPPRSARTAPSGRAGCSPPRCASSGRAR